MPRDLTGAVDSQLDLGHVCLIILCSLRLASTVQYVWTGSGNLNWDGKTWKGIGDLGSLGNVSETSALQAEATSIELSSVSPSALSDSMTEIRVGRPVRLYLGFMTPTGVLIGDPTMFYKGAVDKPSTTVDPSPEGGKIKIALENKLIDMQRIAPARITSEEQKRLYPFDTGADFVAALVDSINIWGI